MTPSAIVKDYGKVVLGSKEAWTIKLIDPDGWPTAAADGTWSWQIIFAHEDDPSTAVLSYAPGSVTISTGENTDDTLTLNFSHSPSDTDGVNTGDYVVDVKSADGSGNDEYYPAVRGKALFLEPVGG